MSDYIGLLEEVRNMYPELDVYEKGTVAALKRLLDAIRRECGEKHASAEYNIANILRLLDGTHFTGGTVSAYFDTHRPEER